MFTAFQSAPVIADGRTPTSTSPVSFDNGFNPRPSLLTGEPWPLCRLMLRCLPFQSAPVIADGRTQIIFVHVDMIEEFQSAPVIADGRTNQCSSSWGMLTCFNPRPSLLTGEPSHLLLVYPALVVSIRARHC